jgi:hypothetical protein
MNKIKEEIKKIESFLRLKEMEVGLMREVELKEIREASE